MKWTTILDRDNIREEVPLDKQFIGLWKGAPCIVEFNEDDDHFYVCFYPAQYDGIMKLAHEREGKITHWMEIEMPEDY